PRHPVDNDEERTARLSNLRDNGPHRSLDDPREVGDSPELVFVEPAEERNSLQMSSLRIVRGLGRASACLLCLIRIMEGQAISRSWVELHRHLLRSPVRGPSSQSQPESARAPLHDSDAPDSMEPYDSGFSVSSAYQALAYGPRGRAGEGGARALRGAGSAPPQE